MSSPAVKPLHTFPTIDEFARRHTAGTEAEFAASEKLVHEINKEQTHFQAWVLSKTRQTTKRCEYLLVVCPGANGDQKLPSQNEHAKLRIVFGDNTTSLFWDAMRIENPLASLNITGRYPDKLAAFSITVYTAQMHPGIQPLFDAPTTPAEKGNEQSSVTSIESTKWDSNSSDKIVDDTSSSGVADRETSVTNPDPSGGDIVLADDNAVRVNFLLTASEATKNAELTALELVYGKHQNATQRQIKAFEYFVLLRNAEFQVDLHEEIPHLKTAMTERSWPGSPLAEKFALLDPQQRAVYMHGFNKLQCGICILPGGPGAGKTHFNLFTIAMAQSRPLPRSVKAKGRFEQRHAKVLFIVDMNSPVDDVANRMVRLYDELGMKKSIIRMKGWGSEVRSSSKLNASEDAASGEEPMEVDFTNQFLRTANMALLNGSRAGRGCQAPSLDEAAWQRYEQYKITKYDGLTKFLEEELWNNTDVLPLLFRRLVYKLYRDTLAAADFIATTPVAASNHFRGMFKPDLVYFDESPHARELSNLIAISNFDPIAWIFCGDYRQTVPFVGSDTPDSPNIYRDQMKVSMMERAAAANVIQHELLMNHRAFGGLHELASVLWYGGRMLSGTEGHAPQALAHIRKYLEGLAPGHRCVVPRLLLHLEGCGPEGRDGTSSWNPTHARWVMARVRELLHDTNFKRADRDEPGTILIISPYKKAYTEYKNAIKELPKWAQRRVETRTVDVVQGHEADFVFLDLVKEKSTRFLDDPNRLCVAITRARLGEVILMHPEMIRSRTFLNNSENLRRIHDYCWSAGQVALAKAEPTTVAVDKLSVTHSVSCNAKTDTSSLPSTKGSDSVPATPALEVEASPQLEDVQQAVEELNIATQMIPSMAVSADINHDTEIEDAEKVEIHKVKMAKVEKACGDWAAASAEKYAPVNNAIADTSPRASTNASDIVTVAQVPEVLARSKALQKSAEKLTTATQEIPSTVLVPTNYGVKAEGAAKVEVPVDVSAITERDATIKDMEKSYSAWVTASAGKYGSTRVTSGTENKINNAAASGKPGPQAPRRGKVSEKVSETVMPEIMASDTAMPEDVVREKEEQPLGMTLAALGTVFAQSL